MSKTILFVDDDADDREVIADVLKIVAPSVQADFAENGLAAIEYLEKKKTASTLPCLVVLDLNMPFLDGRETFKKIKSDQALASLPVIIFTSSQSPADKSSFNNLGVEFFTKPDNLDYYNKIISHMVQQCGQAKD